MESTNPSAPSRRGHFTGMVWVLVLLLSLWFLPHMVERVEYALVRGRERAQVETARSQLPSVTLAEISQQSAIVARAIGASVVHVDTTQAVVGRQRRGESSQFTSPRQYQVVQGQGSGVIIDEAGYVLTNAHVVDGAQEITVKINDFDIRTAEVVGFDEATDLAVLRIAGGGLIAAEWGDSEVLPVGALVWAVGNPFGLDRSVTLGIISAKNRRVEASRANQYQDFLQTDAAVNPGNSGGPLVDSAGKVVGINTAIVGQAYQGVSFSIPSSIARGVYEQLRAGGHVERGYLGVWPTGLTPDIARKLGMKSLEGALVEEVFPGTPADKAKLQAGDVIIEWNEHPVIDDMALKLLVGQTQIGAKAKITFLRDGEKLSAEVTVEALPPQIPRRR